VCGVAMREGFTILIADMCLNDSAVMSHPVYVPYNAKRLPRDAGIKVGAAGRAFKVITVSYTYIGIHMVKPGQAKLLGFDFLNSRTATYWHGNLL